jgi:hypothetical protein
MAAIIAIKERMSRELWEGGFRLANLIAVLVAGAIGVMGHSGNVLGLGEDYKRGHDTLATSDQSMVDYDFAIKHGGLCEERMSDLCASTGVVNIGVYRGQLYVMYKWLVRIRAPETPSILKQYCLSKILTSQCVFADM